jgi:hypothetical protein
MAATSPQNMTAMTTAVATTTTTTTATLRLLLVSGKRHDFQFSVKDTIGQVKVHVFDHWPSGLPPFFFLSLSQLLSLSL